MKVGKDLFSTICSGLPLAVFLAALSARAFAAPASCDPRAFGAKGDGVSKDTAAIQKAIDTFEQRGGGIVRLTPGTYLSAPIVLKSDITLELEKGATLLGSPIHADYPAHPEFQEPGKLPLVGAVGAVNVTIRGEGTIDGSGSAWWLKKGEPEVDGPAPKMMIFDHCRHLLIEGVTIQNSPGWNVVPYASDDVVIRSVKILAPANSPNTDAIDPFSSSNVRIDHVVADVGDDDIAIKAGEPGTGATYDPSRNITITDCTFLHGHGLSVGSDVMAGVSNVLAERIHFEGTNNGIRIKSNRDRGGEVSHLVFRDLDMKNVKTTINVYEYSGMETRLTQKGPSADDETAQPVTKLTPHFHDILIENLTSTASASAGEIVGLPEAPVSEFVLRNVKVSAERGLVVRYAHVTGTNVAIESRDGTAINKETEGVVSLH
jgi:polygalacturonase